MSQSIKLSDELYQELKGLADRECRTVPLMIQYMVQNWGVEKNKTENPAWDIPKPSCEIRSGSQANNEKPNGEHIGRREVKSVPQLIEEINLIKARYAEEAEFCQDQEQLNNLNKNMAAEIQPLQAQIDSMI